MPAPLLPVGFDDLLLDNVVEILQAFSDQQIQFDPGVIFTVERDRMAAPNSDELEAGPIVSIYATGSNPTSGASRDGEVATCQIQVDMYVARIDDLSGGGDKKALARLYYLKDQIRAALFAKSATDLGFSPGVIGKKRWGRFQLSPQDISAEVWTCSASWNFEIDYAFDSQDLDLVDLTTVYINAEKQIPQDPYSTRWAGLYTV